jgi:hypothetical protein
MGKKEQDEDWKEHSRLRKQHMPNSWGVKEPEKLEKNKKKTKEVNIMSKRREWPGMKLRDQAVVTSQTLTFCLHFIFLTDSYFDSYFKNKNL